MAYKMIEELQLKLYHPFSISLMRTRETLLKVCSELNFTFVILFCFPASPPEFIQIYNAIDWKTSKDPRRFIFFLQLIIVQPK